MSLVFMAVLLLITTATGMTKGTTEGGTIVMGVLVSLLFGDFFLIRIHQQFKDLERRLNRIP
jgi:hypothetical protein